MFCPKCGQHNPGHSTVCARCGAAIESAPPMQGEGPQPPGGQPPTMPYATGPGYAIPNHLVWAILTTLFCCLPFGIVAIISAAQVNGHIASGNMAAAQTDSANAKKWCWCSFACGLIFGVAHPIGAVC